MRRVFTVAVCAVAAALVLAAAGSAKTFKVNWNETKTFPGGYLSFHVTRIVVTATTWKVTASFTNHGKTTTLTIARGYPPAPNLSPFGLAYPVVAPGQRPTINTLQMSHASPSIPARFGPGKTWTGSFNGYGVLPKGKIIWVVLGFFIPGGNQRAGFNWITSHAFKL